MGSPQDELRPINLVSVNSYTEHTKLFKQLHWLAIEQRIQNIWSLISDQYSAELVQI